jgi:hypothetical protein
MTFRERILWVVVAVLLVTTVVRSQASATHGYAVAPTWLLANCPSGAIGAAGAYTNFCSTGDGKQYACLSTTTTCATSTAGWIQIAGPTSSPASVSITLNGLTKVLPASFTIAAQPATVTSTAQPATITTQ